MIFGYVVVLLVAATLRIHDVTSIPPALHFDEGLKMLRHWRYASGLGLPMVFNEAPEPFDAMVRGVFGYFVGIHPPTMRFFTAFLNVLATAATIAAARALFTKHPHRNAIALVAGLSFAAMPATIIIGRAIYRANWIAPMTMMALAAVALAWRTGRARYYVAAGVFAGIAPLMYPAGVFVPPTIVGLLIAGALLSRRVRQASRYMVASVIAILFVMIPWFYLYITVPDWLTIRLDDLSGGGIPILSDPQGFLNQWIDAVELIISPSDTYAPMYNTFTDALLNPVLAVLFLIGTGVCIAQLLLRRDIWAAAPLVVLLGMLMAPAMTTTPQEAIRYGGIFGTVSILAGVGAGTVLRFAQRMSAFTYRGIWAGLLLVLLLTPLTSWNHVRDHFTVDWDGNDKFYFTLLRDQMDYIIESDVPVYIGIDYLNYQLSAAYLRPNAFPHIRGYDGSQLPAGDVFLPFDATYGTPLVNRPMTAFALLVPETGEIVILPPLDVDATIDLEGKILDDGRELLNDDGAYLGHLLTVTPDENPFSHVLYPSFDDHDPIAVFDDTLELLEIVTPDQIVAGDPFPVDLYWRLRRDTGQDYFSLLQLWGADLTSFGRQDGVFAHILGFIAPTVVWPSGEIITERRWVYPFPDAPDGGYRLALSVSLHPGPENVGFEHNQLTTERETWLLVDRLIVGDPPAFEITETVSDDQVLTFGDEIELDNLLLDPAIGSLLPGETLTITANWQALTPPLASYTLFLHVLDAEGEIVAQIDAPPNAMYPTDTWNSGFQLTTNHQLQVPDTAIGPFSLRLGLYAYPSLDRLPVQQGNTPLPDGFAIIGGS